MNQDKALYRFVKANERLPKGGERLSLRIYGEELTVGYWKKDQFQESVDGGFYQPEFVEWLEKVEADQQEDNDWLLQCKLKEEYMKKYSEALKEVERLRGILKEADDYLSEPIYEKGKPVYYNNIGAGSILHNKFKPITQ